MQGNSLQVQQMRSQMKVTQQVAKASAAAAKGTEADKETIDHAKKVYLDHQAKYASRIHLGTLLPEIICALLLCAQLCLWSRFTGRFEGVQRCFQRRQVQQQESSWHEV